MNIPLKCELTSNDNIVIWTKQEKIIVQKQLSIKLINHLENSFIITAHDEDVLSWLTSSFYRKLPDSVLPLPLPPLLHRQNPPQHSPGHLVGDGESEETEGSDDCSKIGFPVTSWEMERKRKWALTAQGWRLRSLGPKAEETEVSADCSRVVFAVAEACPDGRSETGLSRQSEA